MLKCKSKYYFYNINIFSQSYVKGLIFYFSYYRYIMKCKELKTEVIRTDDDFYFLRDNLLKIYPATVVRLFSFLFQLIDSSFTSKISF